MLETLSIDSFRPHLGSAFVVQVDAERRIELHLDAVVSLTERHGTRPFRREPFSLTFSGPPAPLLAQQIVPLQHAELGSVPLFLVPLGADAQRSTYEAIFT